MIPNSPFSSRVSRSLLIVAIISVVVSIVLALFGDRWFEPTAKQTDSYNRNVLGHRAWLETLQNMGFLAHRLTHPRHQSIAAPMFFVEPNTSFSIPERTFTLASTIRGRMKKGWDSVLVLSKWRVVGRGKERRAELRRSSQIRHFLYKVLVAKSKSKTSAPSKDPSSQSFLKSKFPFLSKKMHPKPKVRGWFIRRELTNQDAMPGKPLTLQESEVPFRRGSSTTQHVDTVKTKPLTLKIRMYIPQSLDVSTPSARLSEPDVILGSKKRAFMVRYQPNRKQGSLWIVTDPDLLHNFNIHRGHHSILWLGLIRYLLKSQSVFIDECFHGHAGSLSIVSELSRFPAILFTFQGLLVLALFAWGGMRRWGKIRPVQKALGRGPQEIIDITAWVLICGQRPDRLVAAYIQRILSDLYERLKLNRGLEPLQLAAKVDSMAERKSIQADAVLLLEWSQRVLSGKRVSVRESLHWAHRAWSLRKAWMQSRTFQVHNA